MAATQAVAQPPVQLPVQLAAQNRLVNHADSAAVQAVERAAAHVVAQTAAQAMAQLTAQAAVQALVLAAERAALAALPIPLDPFPATTHPQDEYVKRLLADYAFSHSPKLSLCEISVGSCNSLESPNQWYALLWRAKPDLDIMISEATAAAEGEWLKGRFIQPNDKCMIV